MTPTIILLIFLGKIFFMEKLLEKTEFFEKVKYLTITNSRTIQNAIPSEFY